MLLQRRGPIPLQTDSIFDPALWNVVSRTAVLVIDDLGAEPRDDDRTTPAIAALVCDRGDAARKTLITTNMDHESFRRRYGERVFDRLIGKAWHGTRGPSLRARECE
jgi:DNA replication protein DnaC